jgi:aminoglycoside phosphotransferase (APT) family kinase protein
MAVETASAGATIVAPEVRDLDQLSGILVTWLSGVMPNAGDLQVTNLSYPLGAGMSHETILFEASWHQDGRNEQRGMVVRIKPSRHLVYQDDMFSEQYRLVQLMQDIGLVRVAQTLWFEADPSILGAPFFVMEKVAGRVAVSYPPYSQSGWLVDATPAQRATLWHDAVRQLASIQRVPVEDASFLALPGAFAEDFDQETDRWQRYLDWVDPDRNLTLLRQGFDQLLAHRPDNRPPGIVWGDARLGNLMVADDYTVAAVMDWEQPSLGGALHDLGWWLYSDHVQTEARGIPALAGMGSRAETIALWSEVSGKSAADIDWYEIFAVFKMECLGVRMASLRNNPVLAASPGTQVAKFLAR